MTPLPATPPTAQAPAPPPWADALDRRDRAWWADFAARVLVLAGGMSAIFFIGAIFVFIGTQGLDFLVHRLDL